jgi:hypothetical protein
MQINNLVDGNPLHLWRIYELCRKYDLSFPRYVLEYFDGVAQGLLLPVFAGDALRPLDKDGNQPSVAVEDEDGYVRHIVIGADSAFNADKTLKAVIAAIFDASGMKLVHIAERFGKSPKQIGRWIKGVLQADR